MKDQSLSDRIYKYLLAWKNKNPEHFVSGIEIERLAGENGFKFSNASRRCREMQEEGIFKGRDNTKKSQRLRWRLQAKGEALGLDPEVFYNEQMEKIINAI